MGGKPRAKPLVREARTRRTPTGKGNYNIYSAKMAKTLAANRARLADVTYLMVGQSYEGLKELRSQCGTVTDQELVRRALTVVTMFAEMKKSGSSLAVVDSAGGVAKMSWDRVLKPR